MSARVSHHPLVVNTADGACWTRRAVTSDGRGMYALAGAAAGVPDEVLTSLAELAELGIVGSAFALPVPVGPALRGVEEELIGANLSLYEEELENARLRLALKSAQRRALRRLPHEREGLIFRLEQDSKQLHAFVEIANEAARVQREAWEGAQDELERLRARVAELEAERQADHETWQHDLRTARDDREATAARIAELELERHSTNDALADITVAERSADRLTALFAPTQALRVEAKQPGACEACGSLPERWCPDCAACEKGCFGSSRVGEECSHANAPWGGV